MIDTLTVYRTVARVVETCPYGESHEVTYVERKKITDSGERRIHDNGYEQNATTVFVDAQGRRYHRHVEVDFSSHLSYVRMNDGALFGTAWGVRSRLPDGSGLHGCPDGRSLAEVGPGEVQARLARWAFDHQQRHSGCVSGSPCVAGSCCCPVGEPV